jgi:5-methylcytosine-specific restriction endonuclease McrA
MNDIQQLTIAEYRVKYPPTPSRGRWHFIRINARKVLAESNIKKSCKVCGYSVHVEVCHIKSISSFTETDTISQVNSLENLVYLCPNHHWEYDHLKQ